MTATFSKDVTLFYDVATDIVVSNGTVSNVSPATGPASVYTFDVTPAAEGLVTVDIPANIAQDDATNLNFAAVQYAVTYDITPPAVQAARIEDTNADGTIDRVTITLDENLADTVGASNGFDVSSATNHGSCNSEIADPDGTNILNIDFTCSSIYTAVGDLNIDFSANSEIKDAAGNDVISFTLNSGSAPAITDAAAPIIVSTTPADFSAGNAITTDVVVNFSEPMNTGTLTVTDDDSNNFTGTTWSNGDMTATLTHDDWTFNVTINATVDAADLAALSINGAGNHTWSFATSPDQYLGRITVALAINTDDNGEDLSNGVATAGGGNILIDNITTPLNNVTTGDLVNDDLSGLQLVGDQTVLPEKAIMLKSTGDITLQNAGLSNVSVLFETNGAPDNTTILGCLAWDGTLHLKAGSGTGTAPTGYNIGGTIIEIGSASCPLLLTKPATITLTGVTGPIAYKASGSSNWYEIATCGGTYAAPTPPAAPVPFGECTISDGTDTKIITYHFTTFGQMITATTPPPPPSGSGSGYYIPRESEQSDEEVATTAREEKELRPAAPQLSECLFNEKSVVPFIDIAGNPNKPYIEDLYRKCAVSGKTKTQFAPYDSVSRAELSKSIIIYNDLGLEQYVDAFGDVNEDDWFAKYMLKAVKLGIINMQSVGRDNKILLSPNKFITRAEAIFMVLKAKGVNLQEYDKRGIYVDVKPQDWFYKTASYVQNEKLIGGYIIKFEEEGQVKNFYSLPRLLSLGDTGADVKDLKMIMTQLDYYSGKIDMDYDNSLAEAVKKYQTAYDLPAVGNMGPMTKDKIMNEYLHAKTISRFRPYDLIARDEAAKVVYASHQPAGTVLGVSHARVLDNFVSRIIEIYNLIKL